MIRAVALVAAMAIINLSGPSHALASSGDTVVGTADFRDAPVIVDGDHGDIVLVGETVWYGVRVAGGEQRIRVGAGITDERFADRVEVEVELFGPDLRPVAAASGAPLDQVVSFGTSDDDSIWFVSIRLRDVATLSGAEVPVTLTIDGAATAGTPATDTPATDTPATDTLADRAVDLDATVRSLETELDPRNGAAVDISDAPTALSESERLDLFEERRTLRSQITDLDAAAQGPTGRWIALTGVAGFALGFAVVTLLGRRRRRPGASSGPEVTSHTHRVPVSQE